MNYDIYKQAFDMVQAQNHLLAPLILFTVFAPIGGVFVYAITRGKIIIIPILVGVALFGTGLTTVIVGHQNNLEQEVKETARFSSWVDKNYDLNLTKKETRQLENGEVVKDYNGQLQKLTLEEYKDGVVVMNDGKAIKQK
jgi:hypothetical protein